MGDTAVDNHINPHMDKKDSAYRRSNKPYMEKKRRARINSCLNQLKTLVLQAMRKDTNQYSKLEKADILEMTVKHLRQLQRQHVSQAISCDPTVVSKYKAGFNECAGEVVRYLGSVQGVNGEVRNRLMNHLGNVVTSVNTQSAEQQTPAQPLNVQIPQHLNQNVPNVPSGCLLMPAGVQASPLVLQQQQQIQNGQNIQNLSNAQRAYAQGQIPSPERQRNYSNSQVCGQFQIVPNPNNSSAGAVAVYLGQSPNVQPSPEQPEQAVPLYTSHTPPRTKASMKSFDNSAFSQVKSEPQQQQLQQQQNISPSLSPMSQVAMTTNLELKLNGIDVNCGRTPSPLKIEDVWRPW